MDNRILVLFTDEYPYSNGETFIESEIGILCKEFNKVFIITKDLVSKKKRDVPDNVTVIRNDFTLSFKDKLFSFPNAFSLLFIREIIFLLKKRIKFSKTNLNYMLSSLAKGKMISKFISELITPFKENYKVYLYSYWCMDETIGISFYKRSNNIVKAITRAHGMDLYFYRGADGYLPYRQFILDSLDSYFSISYDGLNYLEKEIGLDLHDKVKVAHLGTAQHNLIDEIVLSEKAYRIFSCSNIYPNKRIHLIPDSMKCLTGFGIEWNHFGEYMNFTSDDYKVKFNASLKSIDKTEHSYCLNDRVPNKEFINHLGQSSYDLLVNVSEFEGVPVSIMEAFSFGIPVIATRVGGVSDIVKDNYNGFLLDPDAKPEQIANMIIRYYNLSIEEVNELRRNAFDTWNKHFNANTNYRNFIASILKL